LVRAPKNFDAVLQDYFREVERIRNQGSFMFRAKGIFDDRAALQFLRERFYSRTVVPVMAVRFEKLLIPQSSVQN
jgi:hypothetical protein